MTDMLHKPIGWDDPLNQMTEEEWKEYFRLREDLDVEMSEEEIVKTLKKVIYLIKSNKQDAADKLMQLIPLEPRFAYLWKLCGGFKEVMNFNLSEAKKEYPKDF